MLIEAIGYFLLSTVKFAVATLPIARRFPYFEALFISISGGILGVIFFLFLWDKLFQIWKIYIVRSTAQEKPFRMTNRKRRIIKLKNQYGYWGVVILTPVIVSIPIGVFLLLQYYKSRKYKFLHLSLSVTFWGVFLISFFRFLW